MSGSQINPPYKAVWVASAVRTGSMWAYYITRRILNLAGLRLVIPAPSVSEDAYGKWAQKVIDDNVPGEVFCCKTHTVYPMGHPGTRFITTYRDVRDSILSFIRFAHIRDFAVALNAARLMMAITDHYFSGPDDVVLKLRYDDIVDRPTATAQRIGAFLGVQLLADQAEAFVKPIARDQINEITRQSDRAFLARLAAGEEIPNGSMARNFDGTVRFIDPRTGFQTSHVTSKRSGEWRDFFNGDQKAQLRELAGEWLRRYGFPVD